MVKSKIIIRITSSFVFFTLSLTSESFAEQKSLIKIAPIALTSVSVEDNGNDPGAGSKALFQKAVLEQLDACLKGDQYETWNFDGKMIPRIRYCTRTASWFLNKLIKVKTLNEVFKAAQNELNWYQSVGSNSKRDVFFTGYYFPSYRASLQKTTQYKFPIYKRPENPNRTRAEIAKGSLEGQNLEIAYFDNPVDPFLLQIEGAGVLIIKNNSGEDQRLVVNYDQKNGYPYTSLGSLMTAAGISEQYLNLKGMKEYFTELHPELWEKFSFQNQSYTYLKVSSEDSAIGVGEIRLTPKHSIAVDNNVFPTGAFGVMTTSRPATIENGLPATWKTFAQFVINQDTGSAIKTAGRVDIFWGEGEYARAAGSSMYKSGKLYYCLVKE